MKITAQKLPPKIVWALIFVWLAVLATLFLDIHPALAVIYPQYLPNGRTYDQDSAFIKWTGPVGYVSLYHRDGTSLPPSEGGGSCGGGCTETVTRIYDGGSISGNFTYLQTFNVQVAFTKDGAVGTATVIACGQTILNADLYTFVNGAPGFTNQPSPAWNVPTAGDCSWSISASGGYVDVRAVTTVYRSAGNPIVDLRVNGTNGPLTTAPPGSYTLSWTSSNAAACIASGAWSGAQATNSTQAFSGVASGSYTYTLVCSNQNGSATDSVVVNVLSPPTVSVTTPASLTAPANFTASWTSTNATSCTGSNRFVGLSGLTGSKSESGLTAGNYDYTVTCVNAGGSASDTKRTTIYAAPTVDVRINGVDGAAITLVSPATYSATWTSSNATSCTGSSRLAGYSGLTGSRNETNIPGGTTYTYTMVCQNALGASATDSTTVTVIAPLSGTISVTYARLLLMATNLDQPAQTLNGNIVGGIAPYSVTVTIKSPTGTLNTFSRSGSSWSVSPGNAGNVNIGATEQGTWTAWADLRDSLGQIYKTASATWEVEWYPIHARP